MNKIITTDIVDPTIEQPFTANSLDFLQNATKESIAGICESIIGASYSTSSYYVMGGLTAYGTGNYYPGYIYYNGELYYSAGKSNGIAFVNVPVMTLTITNDATADPLTFTDGNAYNVHNVRRMVMSDALTGTGTVDLSACLYLTTDWIANDAYTSYRKDGNIVSLAGIAGSVGTAMGNATTSFTLPVGYRPTAARTVRGVMVYDTGAVTGGGTLTINTNGTIYHDVLTGAGTARYITLVGCSFKL